MNNYKNMTNEEIKEQLEWSDHHEFSYGYSMWAFKEIERLNNIINELEKNWKEEITRLKTFIIEEGQLYEINNIRRMLIQERENDLIKLQLLIKGDSINE